MRKGNDWWGRTGRVGEPGEKRGTRVGGERYKGGNRRKWRAWYILDPRYISELVSFKDWFLNRRFSIISVVNNLIPPIKPVMTSTFHV